MHSEQNNREGQRYVNNNIFYMSINLASCKRNRNRLKKFEWPKFEYE